MPGFTTNSYSSVFGNSGGKNISRKGGGAPGSYAGFVTSGDMGAQLEHQRRQQQMMLQLLGIDFDKKGRATNNIYDTEMWNTAVDFGNRAFDTVDGLNPGIGTPQYGGTFGDQMRRAEAHQASQREMVANFGDSHRAQMNRDFQASANSAMASLEARGMGSSSLNPVTASAMEEARQQSLLGLEDMLLGNRLNVDQASFDAINQNLSEQLGRDQSSKEAMMGFIANMMPSF